MDFVKIKNSKELASSDLRTKALQIAEAGLQAVDTENVISKAVSLEGDTLKVQDRVFPIGKGKILVVGVGKCSLDGCAAMEKILGDKLTDGVAVDVRKGELGKIKAYKGTHPLPSAQNAEAAQKIVDMLHGLPRMIW